MSDSALERYFALAAKMPPLESAADKAAAFADKAGLGALVGLLRDVMTAADQAGIYSDAQGDARDFLCKYDLAKVKTGQEIRAEIAASNRRAAMRRGSEVIA